MQNIGVIVETELSSWGKMAFGYQMVNEDAKLYEWEKPLDILAEVCVADDRYGWGNALEKDLGL